MWGFLLKHYILGDFIKNTKQMMGSLSFAKGSDPHET